MKGTNLGEFEELVMLTVGSLYPEAYGVSVKDEIRLQTGRKVTLSTVHVALNRLQEKGYLQSHQGDALPERGGKRKRLFTITRKGLRVLEDTRHWREKLWNSIPKIALSGSLR